MADTASLIPLKVPKKEPPKLDASLLFPGTQEILRKIRNRLNDPDKVMHTAEDVLYPMIDTCNDVGRKGQFSSDAEKAACYGVAGITDAAANVLNVLTLVPTYGVSSALTIAPRIAAGWKIKEMYDERTNPKSSVKEN
ncbi:MAG: hypothetical protein FWC26_02515 [Fibromonadales bacterium]|nr:hypothetical protein [Fibromonadales bacterium]